MTGDVTGRHSFGASQHGPRCACVRCGDGFPLGNRYGVWFEQGNRLSIRHGLTASPYLRDDDRQEVAEITEQISAMLPVQRPEYALACEQLAVKLWRQRRGYRYLSEQGLVGEDGKPHHMLSELAKVENQIARDLDALGLTPRSAARLGVDVLQGQREASIIEHFERKREEDAA